MMVITSTIYAPSLCLKEAIYHHLLLFEVVSMVNLETTIDYNNILINPGKISCKILDTLQEKGHFPCKILAPCKFLTTFLLLAKNCARNVKFLAQSLQVLQVSCKKGDIFTARLVHKACKHLQDIFPWESTIELY